MKNWKTTLAGLVPIIGAVYYVAKAIVDGTQIDIAIVLSLLGSGTVGIVAKDNNVTGGTKQQ